MLNPFRYYDIHEKKKVRKPRKLIDNENIKQNEKKTSQEMLTLVIGQFVPKNAYTFKAYLCLFYYQKFHNCIIRKILNI
jgi:hypothetical protein